MIKQTTIALVLTLGVAQAWAQDELARGYAEGGQEAVLLTAVEVGRPASASANSVVDGRTLGLPVAQVADDLERTLELRLNSEFNTGVPARGELVKTR